MMVGWLVGCASGIITLKKFNGILEIIFTMNLVYFYNYDTTNYFVMCVVSKVKVCHTIASHNK
jgi:hypothetical protein